MTNYLNPVAVIINEENRLNGLRHAIATSTAHGEAMKAIKTRSDAHDALLEAQSKKGKSPAEDKNLIKVLERSNELLKKQKMDAYLENSESMRKVEEVSNSLAVAKEAVAERDVLILDWMHSNQAFKSLAIKFGRKAGLSDAEIVEEYNNAVLDVAEEDPKFEGTNLVKKVVEKKKFSAK